MCVKKIALPVDAHCGRSLWRFMPFDCFSVVCVSLLNFDASLSWSVHITVIVAKASKWLYFLKHLKRAGVPAQKLLHFYAPVIRPVLEYCAPGWHYAITWSQAEQLKSIQKRAIHIIYPFTWDMSYSNILFVSKLTSLQSRRHQLSRSFFQDIVHPSSSLYHLLPPPRDTSALSRLRTATRFAHPVSRTKKYCSFINYALNHYRVPPRNS